MTVARQVRPTGWRNQPLPRLLKLQREGGKPALPLMGQHYTVGIVKPLDTLVRPLDAATSCR